MWNKQTNKHVYHSNAIARKKSMFSTKSVIIFAQMEDYVQKWFDVINWSVDQTKAIVLSVACHLNWFDRYLIDSI